MVRLLDPGRPIPLPYSIPSNGSWAENQRVFAGSHIPAEIRQRIRKRCLRRSNDLNTLRSNKENNEDSPMKYLDMAIANTGSSDPEIANAAIKFIDAHDAVENARLALDKANERLIDAQGTFLSLIGQ
jgi:hypothetical protein